MINRKIYTLQAQEIAQVIDDKKPITVVERKKPIKLRHYTPVVWEQAAVQEIKNQTPPEEVLKKSRCVIL